MALWSFPDNIFGQNQLPIIFHSWGKVWEWMKLACQKTQLENSLVIKCVLVWRTLDGKQYCFVLFVWLFRWKSFWKTNLTILVPITSSHLDVNGLIRKARLSGLHLFPIYSCQEQARPTACTFLLEYVCKKCCLFALNRATSIYSVIM